MMLLYNKVLLNRKHREKQEKDRKVLQRNKVLQKKEDPLHREAEEQDKKILLKKKLLVKEEDPLQREAEEQDKKILIKKKLLVKEEAPLHRSGLGALLNEPGAGWVIQDLFSTHRDQAWVITEMGCCRRSREDAWVIR
ncbi:hypothetical protein NE237_000054 [Protea cynaroides]|uniref:Uncharacterized protein n=1 Tax=Protea cynaroides TaxID=273540 RepID=A0A9Q0GP57_9MAGN|nr:hypothetical protein NE237_000054 [Protea cynaroides]